MANTERVGPRSFVASADLRTKQFFLVKLHTVATQVALAGAAEDVVGVLQNKPNTGEAAEVAPIGAGQKLKCVAGAAIAIGARIGCDAAGKARTAAAGDFVIGRADTASTADLELIEFSDVVTSKREA